MPVHINKKENQFHLYNEDISYIIGLLPNGELAHIYFGAKLPIQEDYSHLDIHRASVLAVTETYEDMDFSLTTSRCEFPHYGSGDYRQPAYKIRQENGSTITEFSYQSYQTYQGVKKLNGLPCVFGPKKKLTSLEITLRDKLLSCDLILTYTIVEDESIIVRNSKVVNHSKSTYYLESLLSANIDLFDADYQLITLDGAWSRERHLNQAKIRPGIQTISSTRGASSASHNPFICLKRNETTENLGEAIAMALIYSGNFVANIQVDDYDITRVNMGINPEEFEWKLAENEEFTAPQVVLTYSNQGLNKMSQSFHRFTRNHLMKSKYANQSRPILINNWEATYFSFNEAKIIEIAEKAKIAGIELFVLDDGWFGSRDDDTTSLGDWISDYKKLPNGIEHLAQEIKAMGLKFGLWFEPEMVNEKSQLASSHPEYIIKTPNRKLSYGRNQFVLDFANPDVVDHIYQMMEKIIIDTNLDYIKWDMNRNITQAFSLTLSSDQQKEFFHRYILGVYKLYEKLTSKFPDVLFESCASGGARFDLGMMYYAPQAWTSDDTDAVERLKIQYGTSMLYPIISMGSHVSAIPNHQVLRNTSSKFRSEVAYYGTFGYELDVTKLSKDELAAVKNDINKYKKLRDLIQLGTFYRLRSPFENSGDTAWMCVNDDQSKAIISYYKNQATPNPKIKKIKLQGLNPDFTYEIEGSQYSGAELMNFGLIQKLEFSGMKPGTYYEGKCSYGLDQGDFTSHTLIINKI